MTHTDVNGVVAKTTFHCPVCDAGFEEWEPAFNCKLSCEWAAKLNQATGLQLSAQDAKILEPFVSSWEVSRAIRASVAAAEAEAPAAAPASGIPVTVIGGGVLPALPGPVPDSLEEDDIPF